MQVLFFKLDKPFNEASTLVFSALGFNQHMESETTFNAQGYYFYVDILDLSIVLDENNYDYEDMFNYMLTIKKSIGSAIYDENSILGVAEIVASIIATKLEIDVAIEHELRNPNNECYSLNMFSYDGEKLSITDKTFMN